MASDPSLQKTAIKAIKKEINNASIIIHAADVAVGSKLIVAGTFFSLFDRFAKIDPQKALIAACEMNKDFIKPYQKSEQPAKEMPVQEWGAAEDAIRSVARHVDEMPQPERFIGSVKKLTKRAEGQHQALPQAIKDLGKSLEDAAIKRFANLSMSEQPVVDVGIRITNKWQNKIIDYLAARMRRDSHQEISAEQASTIINRVVAFAAKCNGN